MDKDTWFMCGILAGLGVAVGILFIFTTFIEKHETIREASTLLFDENLTAAERAAISDIIADEKALYRYKAQEVYFTKDNASMQLKVNGKMQNASGINFIYKNKIRLLYTPNGCELRATYCHELLHNFVGTGNNTLDELIVDELSLDEVCYKTKRCEEYTLAMRGGGRVTFIEQDAYIT